MSHWWGGGFIPIIAYGSTEGTDVTSDFIITEAGDNITDEMSNLLVTELG